MLRNVAPNKRKRLVEATLQITGQEVVGIHTIESVFCALNDTQKSRASLRGHVAQVQAQLRADIARGLPFHLTLSRILQLIQNPHAPLVVKGRSGY